MIMVKSIDEMTIDEIVAMTSDKAVEQNLYVNAEMFPKGLGEDAALHLLAASVTYAAYGRYDDGEDIESFRNHLCNLTTMSKSPTLSLAMRQVLKYHAHVLSQLLPHSIEKDN